MFLYVQISCSVVCSPTTPYSPEGGLGGASPLAIRDNGLAAGGVGMMAWRGGGAVAGLGQTLGPNREFCISLNSFRSCQESSSAVIAAVKITQYSCSKAVN